MDSKQKQIDNFFTAKTKRTRSPPKDYFNETESSEKLKTKRIPHQDNTIEEVKVEPASQIKIIGDTLVICFLGEQKASNLIASFDMDWTLIQTKSGKQFAQNSNDWKFWHDDKVVP